MRKPSFAEYNTDACKSQCDAMTKFPNLVAFDDDSDNHLSAFIDQMCS